MSVCPARRRTLLTKTHIIAALRRASGQRLPDQTATRIRDGLRRP
ncbi:hypothetical protein [Saccharopolyspora shandongensis]